MVNYAIAVTGLSGLTVPQKVERGGLFVSKLTGNPAFPTPDPALTVVGAVISALADAWKRAQRGSEDDTRHLRQAEDDFDRTMLLLWAYVQHESKGDADVILSSGLDVRDKPTPRREAPAVPADLKARFGGEGELTLTYTCATRRGRTFRVRYRPANTAGPWTEWPTIFFVCKAPLTGLISGTRYDFQVRTESSNGVSGWSNTVTSMVL